MTATGAARVVRLEELTRRGAWFEQCARALRAGTPLPEPALAASPDYRVLAGSYRPWPDADTRATRTSDGGGAYATAGRGLAGLVNALVDEGGPDLSAWQDYLDAAHLGGLGGPAPAALAALSGVWRGGGESAVSDGRLAAMLYRLPERTPAQTALTVLALAGFRPVAETVRRVPVLLAGRGERRPASDERFDGGFGALLARRWRARQDGETGDGRVGWLQVRRIRGGPPGLFPDLATMLFALPDADFRDSLTQAYANVPNRHGECLLWSIDDEQHPLLNVGGGSLGGALLLALRALPPDPRPLPYWFRRHDLDPRAAVSAELLAAPAGALGGVDEVPSKLAAARRGGIRTVVLGGHSDGLQHRGVSVRYAESIDAAEAQARRLRPVYRVWSPILAAAVVATGTGVVLQDRLGSLVDRLRAQAATSQSQAEAAERHRTSQSLLTEANSVSGTDPALALRLAVAADAFATSPEAAGQARQTIVRTLTASGLRATTSAYNAGVARLAVSGRGDLIASVSVGVGAVRLWRHDPGKGLTAVGAEWRAGADVTALRFLADGRLAVAARERVTLIPVGGGGLRTDASTTIEAADRGTDEILDLSASGAVVAGGQFEGSARVKAPGAAASWRRLSVYPNGAARVAHSTISADGRLLVTADASPPAVRCCGAVNLVAFAPNAAGGAELARWTVTAADGKAPLESWATRLALSDDGSRLAVGTREGWVSVWDMTRPRSPRRIGDLVRPDTTDVTELRFSADAGRLITIHRNGKLRRWSVAANAFTPEPARPAIPGVLSAAFLPDGSLVTGAVSGRLQIRSDLRAPPLRFGELADKFTPTVPLAASRGLVALSSGDLVLSDPRRPKARIATIARTDAVEEWQTYLGAAFSPTRSGRRLLAAVVGSVDYPRNAATLGIWDVTRPEAPQRLGEGIPAPGAGGWQTRLAFSDDGRWLAVDGVPLTIVDLADPDKPTARYRWDAGGSPRGWVNAGTTLVVQPNHTWDTSGTPAPTDGVALLKVERDGLREVGHIPLPQGSDFLADQVAVIGGKDLVVIDRGITGGTTALPEIFDVRAPEQPQHIGNLEPAGTSVLSDITAAAEAPLVATLDQRGAVTLISVEEPRNPTALAHVSLTSQRRFPGPLVLARDGSTLMAGSSIDSADAGLLDAWDTSDIAPLFAEPVPLACRAGGGGLNETEWAKYLGTQLAHQSIC